MQDLTPTLKFENETNEVDIEGTVIKLKPALFQIHKSNVKHENANQA